MLGVFHAFWCVWEPQGNKRDRMGGLACPTLQNSMLFRFFWSFSGIFWWLNHMKHAFMLSSLPWVAFVLGAAALFFTCWAQNWVFRVRCRSAYNERLSRSAPFLPAKIMMFCIQQASKHIQGCLAVFRIHQVQMPPLGVSFSSSVPVCRYNICPQLYINKKYF